MMTGQCCSSLFLLFVYSSGSCFLCSSFCLLVLFLFSFFSFLSICVLASLFSGFLPFSSVSCVVFWYVPVSVLFSSFGLSFSVSWVLSYASSSLSFVFVSTVISSPGMLCFWCSCCWRWRPGAATEDEVEGVLQEYNGLTFCFPLLFVRPYFVSVFPPLFFFPSSLFSVSFFSLLCIVSSSPLCFLLFLPPSLLLSFSIFIARECHRYKVINRLLLQE